MFNGNDPYERYRRIKVETAGPLDLVIMMYDGALRFVNQAKKAITEKRHDQANEALKRAQDIIDELNISLNPEAGEVAMNLRSLYQFLTGQLIKANIKKDIKTLETVARLLTTMKSSWTELLPDKRRAAAQK